MNLEIYSITHYTDLWFEDHNNIHFDYKSTWKLDSCEYWY